MQFIYLFFNWPIEKFLGFLLFLIIIMIGFWCLIYILFIIPYWVISFFTQESSNFTNLKMNSKLNKNKKLYEQNDKKLIYKKNCYNKL